MGLGEAGVALVPDCRLGNKEYEHGEIETRIFKDIFWYFKELVAVFPKQHNIHSKSFKIFLSRGSKSPDLVSYLMYTTILASLLFTQIS